MSGKKLEDGSQYAKFDTDGNHVVSDSELAKAERIIAIENEDKKQDAQRNMAWFALFGMLLYPFAVIISYLIGLGDAAMILGDMAPTYFVSVAAIVAAFYAKEGYVANKTAQNNFNDENY